MKPGEGLFITAEELGHLLGLDYKTVLRHKELRAFSLDLGHRIVRWYVPDVEAYLTRKRGGCEDASEGQSKRIVSLQPYLLARDGEGASENHPCERCDRGLGGEEDAA
jgi:hypothetical protein